MLSLSKPAYFFSSACNKAGQPEHALAVYDRMLVAGVKPSATTYTALISAYGKKGMVEKAMEIFDDMSRFGCERNVITYSSLISACEKVSQMIIHVLSFFVSQPACKLQAGRWESALDLLSRMQKEGCKPNTVTYNSLIAACTHNAELYDKAEELFHQMQGEVMNMCNKRKCSWFSSNNVYFIQGCKPDSITYAALFGAYEKAGQWVRALRVYEGMLSQVESSWIWWHIYGISLIYSFLLEQGIYPDAPVYNCLLGVCWETGILVAQARAMQIWTTANQSGHFRSKKFYIYLECVHLIK